MGLLSQFDARIWSFSIPCLDAATLCVRLAYAAKFRQLTTGVRYSARTPSSWTTLRQRGTSSAISLRKGSGGLPTGSPPSSTRILVIMGDLLTRASSSLNLLMMGAGVPAGAAHPCQVETSKPRRPDSAMVGNSGSTDDRSVLLTPSTRNLPDFTCGNVATTLPKNRCILRVPI